jgi:DNA-binding XRE family transcriptional regulator
MRIHRVFCPHALYQARINKGMGRQLLAARAGISVHSLRDIERGYWVPSIKTATALADELNVRLDDLVAPAPRPVTAG